MEAAPSRVGRGGPSREDHGEPMEETEGTAEALPRDVWERLVRSIRATGLTQNVIAGMIGVAPSSLSRLVKRNSRSITLPQFIALCRELSLDANFIISGVSAGSQDPAPSPGRRLTEKEVLLVEMARTVGVDNIFRALIQQAIPPGGAGVQVLPRVPVAEAEAARKDTA